MKREGMKNIIESTEDYDSSDEGIIIIGNLSEEDTDKSEEEIFVEIIKINDEMDMSEEQYNAIIEQLDAMRPNFSGEQNKKLDKVLEILNKDR